MFAARLCLLLGLFTTSAAAEATWSRSAMTAATTYFPAHASVMIVGVGDGAQPVAAALVETLQATDTFEFVIDAKGMGKLDGLADQDIVRRAFSRPLKRLAIVRVFPSGGSLKAVVTVYGAQGQVTTAFTLAPGKTLVDNPAPETAQDGVRTDEMMQVVKTAGDGEGGDDIRYERQALTGMTAYGVFTVENVTFFKNGRLITDTPSLYEALGMADRAAAYRSQAADHRKWLVRGVLLDLVGTTGLLTFGVWALADGGKDYDARTNTYVDKDMTVPWLLTAASAGVLIGGIWATAAHHAPESLTADEAISLVDAHNKKKREAHLAPSALPSGGGLSIVGTF